MSLLCNINNFPLRTTTDSSMFSPPDLGYLFSPFARFHFEIPGMRDFPPCCFGVGHAMHQILELSTTLWLELRCSNGTSIDRAR